MDNLIFFILGVLITILIYRRPLEFTVHHTTETVSKPLDMLSTAKIPESDPEQDKAFNDLNDIVREAQELFGGSDR